MIVLRNKFYSRRDFLPEKDKFKADPDTEQKIGELKIVVETSKKKWEQDMSNFPKGSPDRIKINQLKNDIKDGYYYEDGPNGGDTHWLKDFSHKDSHLMSKIINNNDRLNYRVYPPEVVMLDSGEFRYQQRIVLESCKGHERNGAANYSEVGGYDYRFL
jgi:hypothetical protein